MCVWLHTAQTPSVDLRCLQSVRRRVNKRKLTASLLTHVGRSPDGTTGSKKTHKTTHNELQPDTEGYVAQKSRHLKCISRVVQCGSVCACCVHVETAQRALSGCLRDDLCRPCGDVHSAVKTSFKNTRRHKNNHRLNCINTHTVAPRSRGAAGTNKPCNFSTGVWLGRAAEFPYVCNLMNEEFSGDRKGGNL